MWSVGGIGIGMVLLAGSGREEKYWEESKPVTVPLYLHGETWDRSGERPATT
jgi:hypothetical protein